MRGTGELAGMAAQALVARELTLSVAESCTGGALADALTNVPGSSQFFTLGVIAYSEGAKEGVLGVPDDLLREHGPVSAEVTAAMAEAVRSLAGSSVGVAVTGATGPDAPPGVAVGEVYTAVSREGEGANARKHQCDGGRRIVKERAARLALEHLLDALGS
jgi:PncC family amidohydrolase